MMKRAMAIVIACIYMISAIVFAQDGERRTDAEDKPLMFFNTNVVNNAGNTVAVNGAYSTFADMARDVGFEVNHGKLLSLSDERMNDVDVLVFAGCKMFLYDEDKIILRNFIRNGGGFLVLSLHAQQYSDQDLNNLGGFLKEFGIWYGPSFSGNDLANVVQDTPFAKPDTAETLDATPSYVTLHINQSKARKVAVFSDGRILTAYSIDKNALGRGKVVVQGNAHMPGLTPFEKYLTFEDNRKFLRNILVYLKGSSDLLMKKVKLKKSRKTSAGDTKTVVLRIKNLGNADSEETVVKIALSDDGTLIGPSSTIDVLDTVDVPSIAAGKKTKIKTRIIIPGWLDDGDYYIVAQIDPDETSGDEDTSNNIKASKMFTVK